VSGESTVELPKVLITRNPRSRWKALLEPASVDRRVALSSDREARAHALLPHAVRAFDWFNLVPVGVRGPRLRGAADAAAHPGGTD